MRGLHNPRAAACSTSQGQIAKLRHQVPHSHFCISRGMRSEKPPKASRFILETGEDGRKRIQETLTTFQLSAPKQWIVLCQIF
jgi:hypothetical protein